VFFVAQEVLEQFLENDVCVWFGIMKKKVCLSFSIVEIQML